MQHSFPFPCGINALSLCVISLETNKQKNPLQFGEGEREEERRKRERRGGKQRKNESGKINCV